MHETNQAMLESWLWPLQERGSCECIMHSVNRSSLTSKTSHSCCTEHTHLRSRATTIANCTWILSYKVSNTVNVWFYRDPFYNAYIHQNISKMVLENNFFPDYEHLPYSIYALSKVFHSLYILTHWLSSTADYLNSIWKSAANIMEEPGVRISSYRI